MIHFTNFFVLTQLVKINNGIDIYDIAKEFNAWFEVNSMGIGKTTYEILKLPEYVDRPKKCAQFIGK